MNGSTLIGEMMADRPPEVVYVVCVMTEWPINFVDGDQNDPASVVESIVEQRLRSGNVGGERHYIKVFKARLTDIEEVELLPTTTVRASLRPKEPVT